MPPSLHLEKVLKHAAQRLVLKPGAKPAEILGIYKQFLKVEEHRLQMSHRAGASGHDVAAGRAAVMDIVLKHLFKAAADHCRETQKASPVPLTLMAIGGFGRAELSPFSDIDIMFLHNQPARGGKAHPYVESVVEQVLYMLWDIGLKVGHSTRSLSEAVTQANSDMQSKTSLIESRLLIGDAELYETFRGNVVKNCVKGHVEEYIDARIQDQKSLYEKYGDSVYMQEPNVKNGCGGLRDFQNLIWMAFFKYGVLKLADLRKDGFLEATEQRDLERAYDFTLRVRNAMHYLTQRACDSIGLGIQPKIATDLGYREHDLLRRTEAFMRDYYTHARNIFLITNALADRMALKPAKISRFDALLGRRPKKEEEFDGFVIRAGLITATSNNIFRDDPQRLIRVFLYALQRGAEFSPDLRTLVRQNLRLVNRSFQAATETRDTFLAILEHKGQVARIMRLMHEVEFLGKLIPEFGRLTCLVQHEFFHRYTADEHTLQVIEHLDRTIDAPTRPHESYKKMFQQLEHAHVLYLAILLHDVGKAANVARHAEASNAATQNVAKRFRLSADETAQLVFLVRDHLKLSLLSQRRDLDDHATIEAAVRIVKTKENLDALHLLTFADGAGTSYKTWSDWKEALLWELYHRTSKALAGDERVKDILSRRIERLYKEVSAQLKGKLGLEEIYSHFELMPASYYINTSADEISHHLRLIHAFVARQLEVEEPEDALIPVVEWTHQPAQGYSRVSICTWDRLGLFSKICGSFASADLSVLSAHIYTRGDHVVLDMFDVCDRQYAAATEPKTIQAAETMLQRTLTGREEVDFNTILARMRANRPAAPRIREIAIPTVIEFDNEISKSRTVIEVQTEDRLGLLFVLTQTITDLGLDISFAKISTEKGAAFDIFYVQDHTGQQVADPDQLAAIRAKLEEAIDLFGELTMPRRPSISGKLRRYELLARVTRVINSSLEPATVLNHVLQEAVDIMRATSGSLVLINPHTQLLEIEVSIGLTPKARQLKLAIGRGVTGWVAKTGQPLRVGDVRADPRYISVRKDVRSELAVPLIVEDALIGVLNVDSTRLKAFSPADEELLVALANQAAQVIHNSWLYQAVAYNARKLESLFSVGQSIISTLNLEEILRHVARDACQLMETKVCSLMLLDATGEFLVLRACHGAGVEYLNKPPLPVRESLTGSVVRHRKPLQVYNVQNDDAFRHIELARQEGLISLLSVPMPFGDTVIGALNVYSATPYRYSTQDIKILTTLAHLAAIAITNARLHEKMVEAEEQLRHNERLSTLGLLAAEVAHEIRNPLTVMKMLFHSLDLQFPAGDPRTRDAEIVAEKMDHLNKIVDRLLGYARNTEPRLEFVDINQLLDDVLLLSRRKLAQQGIELTTGLAPGLPRLRADRGQLEQACLNLILNAAEAMPTGGTLTIRTGLDTGAWLAVTFQDTGVGMTADQQARLFEPFLTTKEQGTGLGLAIVNKIITEAHHGRVEVESVPKRGTTFRLLLPV